MATKKTKLKKSSSRDHECKFCNKGFSTERTLSAHMCPKKRRWTDRNTPGAKLGFRVFQRFYELSTSSTKPKTEMEFIKSQYYTAFVKFGRFLIEINPIDAEGFITFVIEKSIPLDKWTRTEAYESYLFEFIQKERPERAIERTIISMSEWAKDNESVYNEFFQKVHPVEATFMIKSGHISPWVLYLADSAEYLFNRLNDEQGTIIGTVIDPEFWQKEFSRRRDDVRFIRGILKEAKI